MRRDASFFCGSARADPLDVLMPLKTQSCKGKGRRLQQSVARDIIEAFDDLKPDDVRSTSMGAGGEDVQMSTAARRQMPYSIECKNTERLNIWNAIEQCRSNAPQAATPLVVFKRNRSETYAVVPWAHLVRLRKRLRAAPAAPAAAAPAAAAPAAADPFYWSSKSSEAKDAALRAAVARAVEPHVRAMVEQVCRAVRTSCRRSSPACLSSGV